MKPRDIIPVLKLTGYRKIKNKIVKRGEPTISYVINEHLNIFKVVKLKLSLSEDAGNHGFNLGRMHLQVKIKG